MTTTVNDETTRRWQVPRIDPNERWVGGAASAIARELGVEPLVIRVSFAVLTLAGAWGIVFYLVSWIVLAVADPRRIAPYRPRPKAATTFQRYLAVAMVVLGLLLTIRAVAFGFVDQIVFPAGFVVTGFLIAWTRQQNEAGLSAVLRIVVGVIVGIGGMIAFIAINADPAEAILLLLVAVAIVAGVGLVAAPSLARIGQELDTERQDRVRADERARVAAHLHDSVLQTLALIQRHAEDPVRTAQLARRQERELRNWLFRPTDNLSQPGTIRLGPALEDMAGDVDAAHGVAVKVITVGDNADLAGEALDGLVAASREAVVNAAKHSGAKRVDVFAERHENRIDIFVRDTGVGFDPEQTDPDRKGISDSIVARMARVGGTATIHSEPGNGTEVELSLPLAVTYDVATTNGEPQ